MLDEACEVLKRLLTAEGPVDYRGEHYQLVRAPFAPRCLPEAAPADRGGGGRGAADVPHGARYGDVMNVVGITPAELRRKIGVLEERCAEVGRDPAEIRKTVLTLCR